MGQFSGKVAIVTGGNSGIGQETAYQLAADGAKVVVAARDLARGQATIAQIKAKGGEAIFVQVGRGTARFRRGDGTASSGNLWTGELPCA